MIDIVNNQLILFWGQVFFLSLGLLIGWKLVVWWLERLSSKLDLVYIKPFSQWVKRVDWKLVGLGGVYAGLYINGMGGRWINVIGYIWWVWLGYYLILLGFEYVDMGFGMLVQKMEKGKQAVVEFVRVTSKVVLLVVGVLFLLSNLGLNVSSLIAGIGIGGIAIALAVQNILGDLFSALAILLDQPFTVGDFIVAGEHRGKVEKIGIKTTRIRSLKGEEIVIPNKELTASVIQNFRRMEKRRVVFEVGVAYETSLMKLKKIPSIIEKIINGLENVEFKRANLIKMADYALVFEVVYELDSKDYTLYVNRQQEIIFKLLEAFKKHKIEIAYPTQVIHLRNNSKS